jgi:hypothetical protein
MSARSDTFDRVTFQPPPGVRSVAADTVTFTDAASATFAVCGVYESAAGSGEEARDFATEWGTLAARSLRVIGEPETETVGPGGWKMTMGAARVCSEQARSFGVLLSVFRGYGVSVGVLPAVGAAESMADALRSLWRQHVSGALRKRCGAMRSRAARWSRATGFDPRAGELSPAAGMKA